MSNLLIILFKHSHNSIMLRNDIVIRTRVGTGLISPDRTGPAGLAFSTGPDRPLPAGLNS